MLTSVCSMPIYAAIVVAIQLEGLFVTVSLGTGFIQMGEHVMR